MEMITTSNWQDLPKELLEIIGKHLETRLDVFRFRAICTTWRSSVPLSYRHFSLSFPVNTILSNVTFCRLEDETRNSACLVKLVESSSGQMLILNPLSISHKLLTSLSDLSKTIDMLNFRLVELTNVCDVALVGLNNVNKAVLFGEDGVLAIYNSGKLGFRKFSDDYWTLFGRGQGTNYDDIMVYKGQFYVVDSWGVISWVDTESWNLVQYSPPLYASGHVKYLVESDGHIYVVDAYLDEEKLRRSMLVLAGEEEASRIGCNIERVDMRVYKLDEEWGTWVHVKSLGDRVFVLAQECCFSVSVKDFPGCEGNCIYFMDPAWRTFLNEYENLVSTWHGPRVFRLDDRSIKTVASFTSYMRFLSLPSMNWSCSSSAAPDC